LFFQREYNNTLASIEKVRYQGGGWYNVRRKETMDQEKVWEYR
jgi:hypothetical protein